MGFQAFRVVTVTLFIAALAACGGGGGSAIPAANVAPVASAGVAQKVLVGSVVNLDGSASSDANGDTLNYAWTLTSVPTGSSTALVSTTSMRTAFTADVAGNYVARLIVNDGKSDSSASTVVINALLGISINSGSGQTVAQHLSLDRPFQVAITNALGDRVSNVPVTFIAKDGSGRYATDDTVNTDYLGYATWMPNYFHEIGTQTISATAIGYGTVEFSVSVVATVHPYDGYFKCNVGTTVEIVNGKVIAPDQWVFGGTLSEVDGSISGTRGNDAERYHFTGKVVIQSPLQASISGVYYTTSITMPGGIHVTDGVWSCIRQ